MPRPGGTFRIGATGSGPGSSSSPKCLRIDVCAYAVMSNHCHLVLSVDQSRALVWDDREVARRWMKLFGGLPLVRSFAAGEKLSEAQLAAVTVGLQARF